MKSCGRLQLGTCVCLWSGRCRHECLGSELTEQRTWLCTLKPDLRRCDPVRITEERSEIELTKGHVAVSRVGFRWPVGRMYSDSPNVLYETHVFEPPPRSQSSASYGDLGTVLAQTAAETWEVAGESDCLTPSAVVPSTSSIRFVPSIALKNLQKTAATIPSR